MAYIENTYIMNSTIEVEKTHSGRYGIKGLHAKKSKPTPDKVKKENELNAYKKLRRLINTNFVAGDIHLVLTYSKECELDKLERQKALSKFRTKMKKEYEKRGQAFRWICVTEYKRNNPHHHLIINEISAADTNTLKLAMQLWPHGRPKVTMLDDTGRYDNLAWYFIKETRNTFRDENYPHKQRWSCSRNLKKPIKKTKIVSSTSWHKDPKPKKGYYIVKDTVRQGISEFTGFGYQYYTMAKLGTPEISEPQFDYEDEGS